MTPEEADKAQQWDKLTGSEAWHLIERHADDWGEIEMMMQAWLRANTPRTEELPNGWERVPLGWVSVKERLPDRVGEHYTVCCHKEPMSWFVTTDYFDGKVFKDSETGFWLDVHFPAMPSVVSPPRRNDA